MFQKPTRAFFGAVAFSWWALGSGPDPQNMPWLKRSPGGLVFSKTLGWLTVLKQTRAAFSFFSTCRSTGTQDHHHRKPMRNKQHVNEHCKLWLNNVYSNKIYVLCCAHFVTSWMVSRHVPLSMAFSRQEWWSVSPFPMPGDLPNQGIEPTCFASPALTGKFFTTEPPENPNKIYNSSHLDTLIIRNPQRVDLKSSFKQIRPCLLTPWLCRAANIIANWLFCLKVFLGDHRNNCLSFECCLKWKVK